MRIQRIAMILAASVVLFASLPAQNLDVELQRAIQQETVTGDMKAAISEYKKIVARAGSNRSIAAKALVHMAECYQKAGDAEARKVYEQVVRDYGDQKEAAAIARTRLGSGATNLSSGIITRQVWSGHKVDAYGQISPDGRFLTYTDWDTGDLALHDLLTGQDRHLTSKGSWNDSVEWAFMSAVSRDGKQVAYGWAVNDSGSGELRLTDVNGSKPRVIVAAKPGVGVEPLDWSPDGKWLAVEVRKADTTSDIGLIAIADGAFRALKSVVGRPQFPPSRMAFSPDGKYLACDVPSRDRAGQWEIHLLATDGSGERAALAQPTNDRVLGWSSGGKLLFASDRTGLNGVWAIAIRDGKPDGLPELIKANVNPYSLGLTQSGALYYSVVSSAPDIYLAAVDFETGKMLSGPTPLAQPYLSLNKHPQWSRDGKYLAYLSQRDANSRNQQLHILAIRSADTGKVRELTPNLTYMYPGNSFSQPVWSPDNRSLLVNGTDHQGQSGVYRIDAENGNAIPVVLNDAGGQRAYVRAWSRDGRTLYMARSDSKSKQETLVARDLQSGQEREILRRDGLGSTELSPDGMLLATIAHDQSTKSRSLILVSVDGGTPRELLRTSNSSSE